jgi:dTDP-4-amino-4,6-dideoxygalactose transaminase
MRWNSPCARSMYATTAVLAAGARPVFVDVDPDRLLMDPAGLIRALAAGDVAAVIATHLYGRPLDMPAILQVTGPRGVPVIEDCAQAHGARWAGRPSGGVGGAAAVSV